MKIKLKILLLNLLPTNLCMSPPKYSQLKFFFRKLRDMNDCILLSKTNFPQEISFNPLTETYIKEIQKKVKLTIVSFQKFILPPNNPLLKSLK